jgi:hypothetical protein
VNPRQSQVSACRFDYGTSTSYGSTAPCAEDAGAGAGDVSVSAALGSLAPGTTYHYRLVATTAQGTTEGSDHDFTTSPASSGDTPQPGGGDGTPNPSPNPGEPNPGDPNPAATVTAAQIKALLQGAIAPHGGAAKLSALRKSKRYVYSFSAPAAGAASIVWYFVPKGAHVAAKPALVASGKRSFASAGDGKITVILTTVGKKMLKHAKRLKLTIKGSFKPAGGSAVSTTKKVTLK